MDKFERVKQLAAAKIEPAKGWVKITKYQTYLNRPGGRRVTATDPGAPNCRSGNNLLKLPKRGGFAPVVATARLTIGGREKTYYQIQDTWHSQGCEASYNAWVDARSARFFQDFFKFSLKDARSRHPADLLKAANQYFGNNLNVHSLKVKRAYLKGRSHPVKYYQVFGFTGNKNPIDAVLMENVDGEYRKLGYFKGGRGPGLTSDIKTEIRDLDGDGNAEIIVDNSVRVGFSFTIHSFDGKHFRKVLNIGVGEDSGPGGKQGINFQGPYVFCYTECKNEKRAPFEEGFKGRKMRVLKFGAGVFKEVDAKALGLKWPRRYRGPRKP